MQIKRLFEVLVIGGAMLGCEDPVAPVDSGGIADSALVDSAPETPDGAADTSLADTSFGAPPDEDVGFDAGSDAGELINGGICPNDTACDSEGALRAGFECCWGSSC